MIDQFDQLDNAIRSVLVDITATAPAPDDFTLDLPRRGRARARWLLPAVAAAIAALVVGLVAVVSREPTTPASLSTSTAAPPPTAVATTALAVDGATARYPTVTARVTRSPATATIVTIDHGSSDGIQAGMAVADAAGLVGIVTRVEADTSDVRLITDTAYSVQCEVDGVSATCQGDGESVNLVPGSLAGFPVGGTGVVRTEGGTTSLAPPGIVVGGVRDTSNARADIELAADLAHLNFVVVIRYVPPSAVPHSDTTAAITEPGSVQTNLPPGVSEPATIAVLDPGPGGDAPVRDNPISTWLGMGHVQAPTRWFVQRDDDGTPVGAVTVTVEPEGEWTKVFGGGTRVMLGDVEARTISDGGLTQIGWLLDGGTMVAGGLGSIDPDALVTIATEIAGAPSLESIAAPLGLSEIEVPRLVSAVRYDTTQLSLTTEHVDGALDLQAIAFVRLGAGGVRPVSELGGYERADGSGWQNLLVPIDDRTFATIAGPPGTDARTMAATIHDVPTGEVAVRRVDPFGQVPPDTTVRFGQISLGRFALYEYSLDDGSECVTFVSLSLDASPRCLPADRLLCPRISDFDSSGSMVVVLNRDADAVTVSAGDEVVPVSIEHALGYTFAIGPFPRDRAHISVAVAGEPVCP